MSPKGASCENLVLLYSFYIAKGVHCSRQSLLEPPESVLFKDSSQLHRFLQPSLQGASIGLCIQQAMKTSTGLSVPPQGLRASQPSAEEEPAGQLPCQR